MQYCLIEIIRLNVRDVYWKKLGFGGGGSSSGGGGGGGISSSRW